MTGVAFASPTAPRGFMAGGRRSDGLLRSGAPNPEGMGSVPYYIPNWAYDNELNNPNNQHVGGGNPFKRVSTVMKHPAFSQLGRSRRSRDRQDFFRPPPSAFFRFSSSIDLISRDTLFSPVLTRNKYLLHAT